MNGRPSRALLIVACFAAGCVKPAETIECGDFTCGAASICSPDGTRCVAPGVVYACEDKSEGDACSLVGLDVGTCTGQLCVTSGCGNGVVEPGSNEICDDGNRFAGDGCSADCKSTELCGDGIVDPYKLEQCDCGNEPNNLPLGCTGVNSDAPNAQCRSGCTPSRCGDGITDAPTEGCDDGNTVSGDGCAADCSGRWTRMQSNTLARLMDVWAVSSTDAWAVGDNRIMRWNGSTWSRQPEIDTMIHNYVSVCGLSATDVFVVGNGRVYRYQGSATTGTWTDVTPGNAAYSWNAVFCRGNQAYLAGGYAPSTQAFTAYAIWGGSAFGAQNVSTNSALLDLWVDSDGVFYAPEANGGLVKSSVDHVFWTSAGVNAKYVTGTSSADLTVASLTGAKHFNTVWAPIANSDDLDTKGLSVVPSSSPAQTLLVGVAGGALACTGAICTASPTGTDNDLNGVWALDATHAFVVGDHGTILY